MPEKRKSAICLPPLADFFPPSEDFAGHEALIEAYYRHRGSLAGACRDLKVSYPQARQLRASDSKLAQALQLVDELLGDLVHAQFMDKALDASERNAIWKIAYLRNNDPRYMEKVRQKKITVEITDGTFQPQKMLSKVVSQEVESEVVAD